MAIARIIRDTNTFSALYAAVGAKKVNLLASGRAMA
jgi:hypothetical protein